jgi:hypothetical protein
MSPLSEYSRRLTDKAYVRVAYLTQRGTLTRYRVVLVAWHADAWHTVRVYDNAHGVNDMHRHTLSGGKQPAETFHHGTPGEAFNVALATLSKGYEEIIGGWLS